MSYQIIEDKFTWEDRPFACSAFVGYPRGHIEIQADFNGNFSTILSPTNKDNEIAQYVGNRTLNGTECSPYELMKFALKASALTLENHKKKIRCVVIADPLIPIQENKFVEDSILIVPRKC